MFGVTERLRNFCSCTVFPKIGSNLMMKKANNAEIYHEIEIRFGIFNSRVFHPNLSKTHWAKIFDKLLDITNTNANEMHKEKKQSLIVDQICWDKQEKKRIIKRQIDLLQCQFSTLSEPPILTTNYTYHTKRRIDQETFDNIRFAYSIEENDIEENAIFNKNNNNNVINKSKQKLIVSSTRVKQRYSIQLNEYVRADLTIADLYERNQSYRETQYLVELELVKYDIEFESEIIDSLQSTMNMIYSIYFDEQQYFMNRSPMSPISLTMRNVSLLYEYEYVLTEKTDGERMFVIFLNDSIYLQYAISGIIYRKFHNSTPLKHCILDGEYLNDIFYVFDILIVDSSIISSSAINTSTIKSNTSTIKTNTSTIKTNTSTIKTNTSTIKTNTSEPSSYSDISTTWKDLRTKNLTERLVYVERLCGIFKAMDCLSIVIKKMEYFESPLQLLCGSKKLWLQEKNNTTKQIDGLIFTPVNQIYSCTDWNIPILKWKEYITIDVRVEYIASVNFTYFHHSTENSRSRIWQLYDDNENNSIKHLRWFTTNYSLLNKLNNKNMVLLKNLRNGKKAAWLGHPGKPHESVRCKYDVVEYKFDQLSKSWIFMRIRKDKSQPNSFYTIKENCMGIIDYIDIDTLTTTNDKIEMIGACYDYQKKQQPITMIKQFQSNNNNHFNPITIKKPTTNDKIEMIDISSYYDDQKNQPQQYSSKKQRYAFCMFNNYVKSKVLNDTRLLTVDLSNYYHLELACGKLGDLNKWIDHNYCNVLAIDSSLSEYQQGLLRLRNNIEWKEYSYYWQHSTGLKLTYIHGDVTKSIIHPNECCLSKDSEDRLTQYWSDTKSFNNICLKDHGNNSETTTENDNNSETTNTTTATTNIRYWRGFDSIGCMFAIHYFVASKSTSTNQWYLDSHRTSGFLDNLSLLKDDGIFCGVFMNSDNICAEPNLPLTFIDNETNQILYEITENKAESDKEILVCEEQDINGDIDEQKITENENNAKSDKEIVASYNIKNITWNQHCCSEPKINLNILKRFVKNNGLKLLMTMPFSQYVNEYNRLCETNKYLKSINGVHLDISNLNDTFLFLKSC
jgi:hypothetical protein